MRGAISLGKILGINVYIHLTFFLIFLWIGYQTWDAGGTWQNILFQFAIISMLFFSVLLHEFGHALAARRYGIGTRRIVLLPIGGVAQIEHMPENPMQELFVTIMGPVVNLLIAIVSLPFIRSHLLDTTIDFSSEDAFLAGVAPLFSNFFGFIFFYNCLLFVFNLIPAFPMDGGRILRALLNISLGLRKATRIAARVGQVLAVAIAILGFYMNPWWILLGVFVFAGAEMELRMVSEKAMMRGLSVAHAMLQQYTTLFAEEPLKRAAEQLLAGSEKDFLVEENGKISGVITRDILIRALTDGSADQSIGSVMKTDIPHLHMDQPLEDALQVMRDNSTNVLPVYEGAQFIGAISLENITEVLLIQGALAHHNGN